MTMVPFAMPQIYRAGSARGQVKKGMVVSASFAGVVASIGKTLGFPVSPEWQRRCRACPTGISEILTAYIENEGDRKLIDILLIKKVNPFGL
jgi:hypothetical protein